MVHTKGSRSRAEVFLRCTENDINCALELDAYIDDLGCEDFVLLPDEDQKIFEKITREIEFEDDFDPWSGDQRWRTVKGGTGPIRAQNIPAIQKYTYEDLTDLAEACEDRKAQATGRMAEASRIEGAMQSRMPNVSIGLEFFEGSMRSSGCGQEKRSSRRHWRKSRFLHALTLSSIGVSTDRCC